MAVQRVGHDLRQDQDQLQLDHTTLVEQVHRAGQMTAERVDHMLNEMRTAFGAVARFTAQDGRVNTPGEGDGQEYTAPPIANDRRPTDFGATGGAGGSNNGNNDRSRTPGVTQTSMSDGRIVQVAPAPAIQLLQQLKDSLLKVIRRFSEPTDAQTWDDCKVQF